jgi:hypothetical protein
MSGVIGWEGVIRGEKKIDYWRVSQKHKDEYKQFIFIIDECFILESSFYPCELWMCKLITLFNV